MRRPEPLRRYEGELVIAHCPPGPSIRGVLVNAYPGSFVLGAAHSLDDEADLAGEIVIPRSPGVFLQVLAREQPR